MDRLGDAAFYEQIKELSSFSTPGKNCKDKLHQ